jgi:hypothetical protein
MYNEDDVFVWHASPRISPTHWWVACRSDPSALFGAKALPHWRNGFLDTAATVTTLDGA